MVKHQHKLPKEVLDCQSLELYKTWLDTALDNLLLLTLLKQCVWTKTVPQDVHFQTKDFCDSVKYSLGKCSRSSQQAVCMKLHHIRQLHQAMVL